MPAKQAGTFLCQITIKMNETLHYDALLSVYLVVAVIYILINYLLNRLSDTVAARQRRKKLNVT